MRRPTFRDWARIDMDQVPKGRRIMASIAIDSLGSGLLLAFVPLYFAFRADVDARLLGTLMTASAALALPAGTIASRWVVRFGSSRTIQAVNYGRAVACVVALVAVRPEVVLLALFLSAFGENAFWAANGTFVSDVTGPLRQQWYALERSIRNGAVGLGAFAAGVAVSVGGDAAMLLIMALNAVSFALAAVLIAGVRTPPTRDTAGSAQKAAASGVYRDRSLLMIMGITLLLVVPLIACAPVLMLYLSAAGSWGSALTGGLVTLNVVLMVALQPSFTARVPETSRPRALVVAGLAILAAGLLLTVADHRGTSVLIVASVVAILLVTLCELAINASLYGLVADLAPEGGLPRYMAAYQLAWALASVLWPILLLPLVGRSGSAVWLAFSAMGATSALLAQALARATAADRRPMRSAVEEYA